MPCSNALLTETSENSLSTDMSTMGGVGSSCSGCHRIKSIDFMSSINYLQSMCWRGDPCPMSSRLIVNSTSLLKLALTSEYGRYVPSKNTKLCTFSGYDL